MQDGPLEHPDLSPLRVVSTYLTRAMAPQIKLTYVAAEGRAMSIRLAFHIGGIGALKHALGRAAIIQSCHIYYNISLSYMTFLHWQSLKTVA